MGFPGRNREYAGVGRLHKQFIIVHPPPKLLEPHYDAPAVADGRREHRRKALSSDAGPPAVFAREMTT